MSTASPGFSLLANASPDAKTSVSLERIWASIAEEMSTAQQLYREVVLASAERNHIHQILSNASADFIPNEFRIDVVDRVSHHFLQAGGKWIRAGLVLLVAHAFGARGLPVRKVAVAVELIHLATLTHDDIIDEAITRRGRASIRHGWGNSIAVLVGDFLFSKAFKLLLESGSVHSQQALAVATGQMCMGEIKQLKHVHRFATSEAQYLETIEHKTAALMAAATQSGGELAGCDEETTRTLSRIGHDFGMAFQIVDDILDYTSSLPIMGKEQGGDLRNGKLTLPLIHLLERRPEIRAMIQSADCSREFLDQLKKKMREQGSFEYSYRLAQRCVDRARSDLAGLLDQCERPEAIKSLQDLTELVLTRES